MCQQTLWAQNINPELEPMVEEKIPWSVACPLGLIYGTTHFPMIKNIKWSKNFNFVTLQSGKPERTSWSVFAFIQFSTGNLNSLLHTLTKNTNYNSETVIPWYSLYHQWYGDTLYITGFREKLYSEFAVVEMRRRLIRAIYFFTTAGDIKRYHRLRTVISLVSGFP